MTQEDRTIKNLLELNDVRYVIDENLGLWVKFEAKQIVPTQERPHGIRYSLTLHDRSNIRIMGFDNAHGIEFNKKTNVAPIRKFDHWHRDGANDIKPYNYVNAGQLMEDFWKEVEKIHRKLAEEKMSNTKHKIVKVGIMSLEDFKKRTIAIAKGIYKPKKDEPKIWFRSMKSVAHVLSEENQELLKLIVDIQPKSIKELEDATGRKANNLLRTLRTMESYGFIKLTEGRSGRGRTPLVPHVIYSGAEIEVNFG